ncbi:HD-GYP domain-containing protein [Alkalicoccus daliensis]|uniref:HDIG domain-containing protein n=1 Tax=Alkalicoccus daliensis TaxID=745820 RepID=A0A1H0JED2_9BACI|nr:HD-GYP domain-containing protein [Alkalicoccus daliensis]SDO42155.1 HDIG domain-containing protein [Alkalicoccus daliensis]
MKLAALNQVKPNTRLAKPIYNDEGQALLQIGAYLTERVIALLKEKGVSYVYIQYEGTEDIEVKDGIDPVIRKQSIKVIRENFQAVSNSLALKKTVDMDSVSESFSDIVTEVLNDVMNQKEAVSLLADVVCYDTYIFHHSLNVTIYSLSLGKALGLNQEELHKLGLGALLHDIGKMSVSANILNKTEKLTNDEFDEIKKHTTLGFEILRKSHTLSLLTAHCAFQHHERLDGSGYPRQIKDKEIHPFAKIIGIVDVFDAVTSHRVYRPAMLPHEGLELLFSGAGTLFDRQMVDTFSKTVAIYPPGLEVSLNGGRSGVISAVNQSMPSRPTVRVMSEYGVKVTPYEVNLSEELSSMIERCETTLEQRVTDI